MTSNHTNQNNAARTADEEIHEAFERRYTVDAEDPANVIELGHFADFSLWNQAVLRMQRASFATPARPMTFMKPIQPVGNEDRKAAKEEL